jgi:hypothetical protein
MPQIDISRPVRLGRAFWSLYASLMGPSIWLLRPSYSGLPLSSVVIGAILIPFLASVALFSSSLFLFALVTDFRRQKTYFAIFFLILTAALAAMAVVIYLPRPAKGISGMPFVAALLASVLANALIFFLFRKRRVLPGPKSGLVSPQQEGESGPE